MKSRGPGSRAAVRYCACGALLGYYKKVCDACRPKNRAASYRKRRAPRFCACGAPVSNYRRTCSACQTAHEIDHQRPGQCACGARISRSADQCRECYRERLAAEGSKRSPRIPTASERRQLETVEPVRVIPVTALLIIDWWGRS